MRFTLIANLISAASAFGLTIIFSRFLHNEDFATIAVWSSLFSWGQFIVSLSSAGFVVRATVSGGRNEGIISIVTIVHYVSFTVILSFLTWCIVGLLARGSLANYSALFLFSCILASLTAIQSAISGFYRFVELHKEANIIQLCFSLGTLVLSCILAAIGVLDVVDRVRIPVVVLSAIFLLYKPGFGVILRRLELRPLKEIFVFVRYSLGFVGHSAAHTIVGGLDRLILSGHVGAAELGNYHVIKQGAESLRIIGQAIQSQMAPKFLKLLHEGKFEQSKALTDRFVMYISAGVLFSFFASIILIFLSGRGLTVSIVGMSFILVVSNAIYSIYDFRSLSWSLGRGYGLSVRSMAVCTIYAIALYLLQSRIDLTNMSITYLLFTISLLVSARLAPVSRDSNDFKIK
ncbi:lipopolysaccharide biosynthesis protein [Vogesella amnigena]|uniref:Lipopolysaccharide biosynthesis protein n=1 Tax=Vogesella amnigena TaxID=1507449 RepID=A0ABV7TU94_9NEIS